jgi:hypothetical protein
MKKWPLPNLDSGKILIYRDWSNRHWFFKEANYFTKDSPLIFIYLMAGKQLVSVL